VFHCLESAQYYLQPREFARKLEVI
jgi:hypothetical protein